MREKKIKPPVKVGKRWQCCEPDYAYRVGTVVNVTDQHAELCVDQRGNKPPRPTKVRLDRMYDAGKSGWRPLDTTAHLNRSRDFEPSMPVAEALERAFAACKIKVGYQMGSGSLDPKVASPADADGNCDCSCFVCWVYKLSKYAAHDTFYLQANGGWRNTDAMALDAKDKRGNLTITPEARPGCIIVYGKGWGGVAVGHVGIVAAVEKAPGSTLLVAKSVIHCSSGNAKTGNAVQETGPEVFFKRKAIYAWPDFLKAA